MPAAARPFKIDTLLLAAGASARLGQPKQLLTTADGTSLVKHMAAMAVSLQLGSVIVVVGADAEAVSAAVGTTPVQLVVNPNWPSGLASSLQAGLGFLSGAADAFMILLTDQPYVNPNLLQTLIDTYRQSGRGIVACRYPNGHLGVPALFNRKYQPDFMTLRGDVGARKLMQQNPNDCIGVDFPQADIDLDTPDDVARWKRTR